MRKKVFTFTLMFAITIVFAATAYADSAINVTINGVPVVFDGQSPVNVDGRTLVPVRGVFEELGFTVDWNGDTQQATLSNANYVVVLTVGNAVFTTNGASHTLDVPAQIINGRTMLPIRAVLESVGYFIGWDSGTSTVLISEQATTIAQNQEVAIISDANSGALITVSPYANQTGYISWDENWTVLLQANKSSVRTNGILGSFLLAYDDAWGNVSEWYDIFLELREGEWTDEEGNYSFPFFPSEFFILATFPDRIPSFTVHEGSVLNSAIEAVTDSRGTYAEIFSIDNVIVRHRTTLSRWSGAEILFEHPDRTDFSWEGEGMTWLRPGEYLIAVVNYDNAETADITGTMQVVAHIVFEAD
jgi:hypothetical protein